MADITITLTINDSAFQGAMDDYINAMRLAGYEANLEAAEEIGRLTRAYLATLTHPSATKTPSGPEMPPAWITGALAYSVVARQMGESAFVGPTSSAASYNGPYGRALELGYFYTAHNRTGYMHWFEDGSWIRSRTADHPDHPFLKPMVEFAVSSGRIEAIYQRRWAAAQAESV